MAGSWARGLLGRALRRGLLGGSRRWQVLLAVLAGARMLARVIGRGPGRVAHSERLRVGERIEVAHLPAGQRGGVRGGRQGRA